MQLEGSPVSAAQGSYGKPPPICAFNTLGGERRRIPAIVSVDLRSKRNRFLIAFFMCKQVFGKEKRLSLRLKGSRENCTHDTARENGKGLQGYQAGQPVLFPCALHIGKRTATNVGRPSPKGKQRWRL
jgi:hypothetical protein